MHTLTQFAHALMVTAAHHSRWYAAPTPPAAPAPAQIDVNTFVHHLINNLGWLIAAALAAWVGARIMGKSGRGDASGAATSGGIYIFGLIFFAAAFVMFAFASGIVNSLFGA